MELGTSVYTYLWECSLEGALERCAGFGFRTLELVTTPPFLRPAHFGPFERRRLGRLLGRLGLKVFSVNPTFLDLNLVSLNPAIRRASLKELKDTIWLAADIGARLVVISAGRRHPLIPAPLRGCLCAGPGGHRRVPPAGRTARGQPWAGERAVGFRRDGRRAAAADFGAEKPGP